MALKNVFSFLETAPKHCSQDSSKVQQRQEQKRDQTGPSCVREVGGSQREGKYSFNAKQQGRLYAEAGTGNLILAERLPSVCQAPGAPGASPVLSHYLSLGFP